MESAYYKGEPTVLPYPDFNAEDDANKIRYSLKCSPVDSEAISKVLTSRSNIQRSEIVDAYKQLFGRELDEDFRSSLNGSFQKLALALLENPYNYLARELYSALDRFGSDDCVLTEILCTRSNHDIAKICEAYINLYGCSLEEAISDQASGEYKQLLVILLNEGRREDSPIDVSKAKQQAQRLHNVSCKKWGTDEEFFVVMFGHEPFHQLHHIFEQYRHISGKMIDEVVKEEVHGDLGLAIRTIVKCAENCHRFYAEKLEHAVHWYGSDCSTLTRIIVSRSEIDLESIKKEFRNYYRKTLTHTIEKKTAAEYRHALIRLLGKE